MRKREARLAFNMLLPTALIVVLVVLGPLLANFWISVKPVELADLRAPSMLLTERFRGDAEAVGDEVELEYRMRNSSPNQPVRDAAFTDQIPEGLTVTGLDERCTLTGRELSCALGDLEGGFRERFRLQAEVTQAFLDNPIDVRQTEPNVTGSGVNVLTSFDFTLENFQRVFDSSEFWFVLRVTIYYTVFSTAGALVVGLFAAQLMNTAFKGRGILRGLFLFPYVAPVIAVAFTWLILLDPFSGTINAMLVEMGLIGAPINFFGTREVDVTIFGFTFGFPVALSTVIAFEAWRYFPLSFLFILAAMQSVSAEMYEAAEMDGATPLQQFWYLSLPQLVGILSVLFLLRFIWTFNKFDDIFLLTGGAAGTRTLTVQVYEQGFALSNLGAGAAVAVVVFFVLLVFALAFFRFSPKEGGA
ncbi:MAG: sugar ABC transporter permease [Rhizobiales bacterium]|nr:sugar ABC transporter permease [Hyphomicrobiales bacterium]MBO6697296.1 sugar ABC transporter permease [Hyphomicrobiales bacterium]MBO6736449.1 sugar ABC transporter permease [Hyphomicrobiales bacterium]MBO6912919.1 sugar ABC transporter permease [Hyphomicrobiales bacterium]MBO6954087.1 sugar ABC transporter permease [Hyphomicrobiales bacterium]